MIIIYLILAVNVLFIAWMVWKYLSQKKRAAHWSGLWVDTEDMGE